MIAQAAASPAPLYRNRLEGIGRETGRLSGQRRQLQWAVLLGLVSLVVLGILADRVVVAWWASFVPVLVLIAIAVAYNGVRRRLLRALRLEAHNQRALRRVTGEAPQSGFTGEEFRRAGHLCDPDLDVLGPDSLFGLLATVRTGVAQRALGACLLDNAPAVPVIEARQAAVRELAPATALREELALLGERDGLLLPAGALDRWREAPVPALPAWVPFALAGTTSALLLLLVAGVAGWLPWAVAERNLLGVLAAQAAVALRVRAAVLTVLQSARGVSRHLQVLREGCELLAAQTGLESPELTRLREAVRGSGAVRALHRLGDLTGFVDARANGAVFVPSLLLGLGTHTAYALARWQRRHAADLDRSLATWAEFEVLLALATYAFEHPGNVFPELVVGPDTVFAATGLQHPLLPAATAVGNDIAFGEQTRCFLISGSNMAGKSTLLRTIGSNAVLAFAGAPIPAETARLSRLQVAASIGTGDSLADGRSRFLAEVDRLRAMVEAATSGGAPVLFLVDEVLGGTNSTDRRAAADRILHRLLASGAIGALSTHDLALTELAADPELHAVNLHMASDSAEDPLRFDFRLRPGVNTASSAEAILRLMGL